MDYVITVATLCDMIAQAYERMALHQQRQQQKRIQLNPLQLGATHPYHDFPIWNASSLDLFGKIDSRFKVCPLFFFFLVLGPQGYVDDI